MVYELDVDHVSIGDAIMKTIFEIYGDEIQTLHQNIKLQGGSKYRQEESFKLLDRIVARKEP
jgi:hypothetical protein